jgi:hypothetical protein
MSACSARLGSEEEENIDDENKAMWRCCCFLIGKQFRFHFLPAYTLLPHISKLHLLKKQYS